MTVDRSADRRSQVIQLRKLAAAIRLHLKQEPFFFKGQSRPMSEAAEYLESSADRIDWIRKTDLELAAARKTRDDDETVLREVVVRLNNRLESALTPQSPELLSAGLKPRKLRATKTSEEKVKVADKARTTRRVLGTRGPKQKKEYLAQVRAGGGTKTQPD